jgi:hypothetical protein
MLFEAILTVVFENVVFNPSKIIQGTYLGLFAQKVVFGKVTFGPCEVFILFFTIVQLSQLERQGPQLSGEKQNKASLSG